MDKDKNRRKGLADLMDEIEEIDDEDALFGRTLKISKEVSKGLKIDKKMSSRMAELGNLYLDKKMSINFHQGFRDLNPKYHQMRHERAVRLANRWLGRIGANLKEMQYQQATKNFKDWLKEGNKLTFDELQKLKDENWKKAYIQQDIHDDVFVQEMLAQ